MAAICVARVQLSIEITCPNLVDSGVVSQKSSTWVSARKTLLALAILLEILSDARRDCIVNDFRLMFTDFQHV